MYAVPRRRAHRYFIVHKPRNCLSDAIDGNPPTGSTVLRETVYDVAAEAGFLKRSKRHLPGLGDGEANRDYTAAKHTSVCKKGIKRKQCDLDKKRKQTISHAQRRANESEGDAQRKANDKSRISQQIAGDNPGHVCGPTNMSALDTEKPQPSEKPAAVGRLDYATSGLMLFTDDAALNLAVRDSGLLSKTYVLTVAGKIAADDKRVAKMEEPLVMQKQQKRSTTQVCKPAAARVIRCWQIIVGGKAAAAARKAGSFGHETAAEQERREEGKDEHAAGKGQNGSYEHDWQRIRRGELGLSQQDFEAMQARCYGGWLTDIEVCISEGKFHQVRKLCQRSKFKLRHLHREKMGPVGSIEAMTGSSDRTVSDGREMPQDCLVVGALEPRHCREVTSAELQHLYATCLPGIQAPEQIPNR
jgi:pseudouridine synthase